MGCRAFECWQTVSGRDRNSSAEPSRLPDSSLQGAWGVVYPAR